MTLNNSTVSGNAGGGIWGGWNGGTLTLNSSTISGNTTGGEGGGGIYADSATVTLQNTILAGNTDSEASPDCSGTIGSAGYNLVGNTSGCTFSASIGDLLNVDARLWSLMIGTPGYRLLLAGSPAIDAGNPTGCVDHLGNPLDTDQRGVPRLGRCDIGSYEFDPANDPLTHVFLPIVARNYCPDFFDDFSNPASGWDVGDDSFARYEYLNGEYRVLTKKADYFYLFPAPTCDRQNYVVEVDARWVGSPGSGYGLVFGITPGFSRYYLFDVNTDYRQFRLLRRDPGGFNVVVPVTSAPAINSGTATNHLKVTRSGDQITLEVNGTVLGTWSDGTITGLTGVGVVSSPYSNNPTSDARFDNFSVISLPGSGAAAHGLSGVMAEAGDSQVSGAHCVPVPADIDQWPRGGDVEPESRYRRNAFSQASDMPGGGATEIDLPVNWASGPSRRSK